MEPKEKAQKTAVFYAVIAASQSPGHLGYAEGINTMKEARNLVVQTMPERRGRIVKTDEDKVLACFPDAIEALKAAIAIQRSAVENRDKKAPLNVRVFIHFGDGQIPEEELQNELMAFVTKALEVAKPGHIYVSTPTYNNAQGLNAVEFKPFPVGENARNHLPYYDVTWHPETDCTPGGVVSVETLRGTSGRPSFFVHGATLMTGPNPPCFYCGSGRHKSGRCPSKQLSNSMTGLEKLGHFSMDEINRIFSEYLNVAGEELAVIPEPAPDDNQSVTHLAPWAFYELKRGYQLRFLDIIWNATPKEDWHKARESKREGSPEGGMLWLARDCIRTSRLDEAEDLLKRYGRKNQTDYRTLCGLALIKIEKENYITAADFLIEALNQPTNGLHKTYILLILSRVYQFLGDTSKSDERLRDALGIEPFCPEAIFEIAIRYFKGRRETDAVNRLVKLIHVYKEYYSAALIAPELAKYQELIAPEIDKILEKARAEARLVIAEAERALSVVKSFAGENDSGVVEVLGDYQEMSSLLERPEALFNYEGIMDMGRRISSNCKEIEHDRSDHALKTIRNLEARANDIIRSSTQPRKTGGVLQPIQERLARLKEGVQSRSPLEPCVAQFEETSREMDEIEASVRRMDASHALFLMWARFSKDIILVFFITGAVGLVLFPGAVSLMAAIVPNISNMQTGEVWGAQKAILLSGGLFALLFAGFRAVMDRYNLRKEG